MTSLPTDEKLLSANPGATLRKARMAKGLSLQEVASQLNLSISILTNLEAGALERLPGHTFARGYVRAYAKLLGLDQAPLVEAYDQFSGSNAQGSDVTSLGRIKEPVRMGKGLRQLITSALLLLVVVAGYLWWQERSADSRDHSSVVIGQVEVERVDGTTLIHSLDEPEDQAVQSAESISPQTVIVTEEVAAPGDEAPATVANAEAVAPVAAQDAVPPTAPAAPAAPVAPAEAVATAQPVAGEGLVSINLTRDCWVQLTDANGQVLLSALKRGGESVEIAGKTPLELRLGYAPGAQVSFNGQPVDLTGSVTGETARIKLGQ
jgi:cytoskeleton protein RodZ